MILIADDLQTSLPKKGKATTVDISAITRKIIKVVGFDIKKKFVYCVPETITYAQTRSSAVNPHHWFYTGSNRGCLAAHSTVQICGLAGMNLLKSGPLALSKNGQSTAICETELDRSLNFFSEVSQYCEDNNGVLTFGGLHQLNTASHLLSLAMALEKAMKSCVGKSTEFIQKICAPILSAIDNAGRGKDSEKEEESDSCDDEYEDEEDSSNEDDEHNDINDDESVDESACEDNSVRAPDFQSMRVVDLRMICKN